MKPAATARKSNLKIIQTAQNKVIDFIADAPWFISNAQLHNDLPIDSVDIVAKKISNNYLERLHKHPNVKATQFLDVNGITRRLSRTDSLNWQILGLRHFLSKILK